MGSPKEWTEALYELLVVASTRLPEDVVRALRIGCQAEDAGGAARQALATILENVDLARQLQGPLCQDTGTIIFWVEAPFGVGQNRFRQAAEAAIVRATREGILRQNCVDSLTGINTGDNLGLGSPAIHWHACERPNLEVAVLLKGGGCENVGAQYALPRRELGAERDLQGVRRCLLDAVAQAQGKGCAPGILGVCIGGDRGSGFAESKRQLLRRLDDVNPIGELADVERRVLAEANTLGIGPMGFGGRTTLLGVKIGCLHRIPASYFVSVSYMCWACRRHRVELEWESCEAVRKGLRTTDADGQTTAVAGVSTTT